MSAKKDSKRKKSPSLDFGLFLLMLSAFLSSVFTFYKFRRFREDVETTIKSNLEIMRDQHRKSLDDLKSVVNSTFSSRPSQPVQVATNSNLRVSRPGSFSSSSVPGYSSLPSGLSICRNGDWYVTDGLISYTVGDVSPIGLITNISPGVVYSDLGVYSFIRKPQETAVQDERRKHDTN